MKYVLVENWSQKDKGLILNQMNQDRSNYLQNHPNRSFSKYTTNVSNSEALEISGDRAIVELCEESIGDDMTIKTKQQIKELLESE